MNKNSRRKKIKDNLKNKPKSTIIVYFILRLLVIASIIDQGIHGNWNNVFLSFLTLVLFTIPGFISNKFEIELPSFLEITVYLFIFSAEILGEIQNFYGIFKEWDTILHTLNGFLCAGVGFSLVDILNKNKKFNIDMSPLFLAIVAFSFSMTIGVLWEFFEFAADKYLLKDMQKDRIVQVISSVKLNDDNENIPVIIKDIEKTEIYYEKDKVLTINGGYLDLGVIDTMKDLFVNFIGALLFSILGYLYVKDRDSGYKFIKNFIPTLKNEID